MMSAWWIGAVSTGVVMAITLGVLAARLSASVAALRRERDALTRLADEARHLRAPGRSRRAGAPR